MQRRSVILLCIMLIAFGAMFAAAGTALKPLAEDAEASRLLTRQFQARGDLQAETRIRLSRLPGSSNRLAAEGRGLVIWLTPSRELIQRRGGLRILALRVAQSGLAGLPEAGVAWVEVCFETHAENGLPKPLKTLLEASAGSQVGEPSPPLPARVRPVNSP